MAPKLVDMVEHWIDNWIDNTTKIKLAINEYLSQFPKTISTLVLWCTHFSVYKEYFNQLFDWVVIDPSFYSAQKFNAYLQSHPEIETKISKNSTVKLYTTWDTVSFDKIWSNLCWKFIQSEHIDIQLI